MKEIIFLNYYYSSMRFWSKLTFYWESGLHPPQIVTTFLRSTTITLNENTQSTVVHSTYGNGHTFWHPCTTHTQDVLHCLHFTIYWFRKFNAIIHNFSQKKYRTYIRLTFANIHFTASDIIGGSRECCRAQDTSPPNNFTCLSKM